MSAVTIQSYVHPNFQGRGPVTLRIYALYSFLTSDGNLVQAGAPGSADWYKEAVCTLSGTDLTIPELTVDSTTDSLTVPPPPQYSAWFYNGKGALISAFGNFASFYLPSTPTLTTWHNIGMFQAQIRPLPVNEGMYYTKPEVNQLLNSVGGEPGGGGVSSFNLRTGDVVLTEPDVVTALDYTPVNQAGDTMTGPLVLSGNPVNILDATPKQYVDTQLSQAGSIGEYRVKTGSTLPADPGSGKIGFNTVTQKDATELYVDLLTQNGFDASYIWMGIQPGRRIAIQKMGVASIVARWTVNNVINVMQFFRVQVTPLNASGGWPLGNNTDIAVGIEPISDEFVPIYGGTMTGPLILDADPVDPLGAATRQFVEAESAALPDIIPPGSATNASISWNAKGQITAAGSASSLGPGGSDFELEQFGGAADGATDNFPAFEAFKSHLNASGIGGATLRLRGGIYNSSGPWQHSFQLRIIGAGPSAFALATQLNFYNGTPGIIQQRTGETGSVGPGGDGSVYECLALKGSLPSDGLCDVSVDTVTRVTGPPFTDHYLHECLITIDGTSYPIASVIDADHLTVGGFDVAFAGDGTNGCTTLTNLGYRSRWVGASFSIVTDLLADIPTTVVSVAGDGGSSLTVTPNHNLGGRLHATVSNYLGTGSGLGYTLNYRHGIELHSKARIIDCNMFVFAGMGICADSSRPAPPFGAGQNLGDWYRIRIAECHGHGMVFFGNDSNAGIISGVDTTDNRGWGFRDISFLGNAYYGCHAAGNLYGTYCLGTTGNCHCTLMNCYSEDDQVGVLGSYGVVVLNGTHTYYHARNVAQSIGVVSTGNFFNQNTFILIGQALRSSFFNGRFSPLTRNLIGDTGSGIYVGDPSLALVLNSVTYCAGNFWAQGNIGIQSGAANPTPTNITEGLWNVWKNTTTGEVRVWANIGGVMRSATLT